MGVALAGVVHHRHCAARAEHHNRKDNQQGGIHRNLAAATPRHTDRPNLIEVQMNRR